MAFKKLEVSELCPLPATYFNMTDKVYSLQEICRAAILRHLRECIVDERIRSMGGVISELYSKRFIPKRVMEKWLKFSDPLPKRHIYLLTDSLFYRVTAKNPQNGKRFVPISVPLRSHDSYSVVIFFNTSVSLLFAVN